MGEHLRIHVYPAGVTKWLGPALPDHELVAVADEDEFVAALPQMEVLVTHRPPPGHWARAERLRLLHASGAGVDDLLPVEGLRPEAVIANASGIHLPAMSEWIVAAVLAATKQFPAVWQQQESREWKQRWGVRALAGSKISILGLGTIGADVARLLAPFDVTVVGTQRTPTEVEGVATVYRPDQIDDALHRADVAIVLLPLTAHTRGAVGAAQLDRLADGAVVVDVSRGGVTDLDAVVERLGSGSLGAAVIDVFPTEPLPSDSPYWSVPGLIVTPHTAGVSTAYLDALGSRVADNIALLESGRPLVSVVDRAAGY